MATLIQSYEQQYSVLTADITSKIGRLKTGKEEGYDELAKEILANFEEANDLLEQLELESRGAGAGVRVPAYRAELQRVKEEYRSVLNNAANGYIIDLEESFEDWGGENEQHRKLLDNSERLERTGKTLNEGYKLVLETEQIGTAVLQDLSSQRETIQRSRSRLRETDEHLNRSSRLMNSLMMRTLQYRILTSLIFVLIIIIFCAGVYFSIT